MEIPEPQAEIAVQTVVHPPQGSLGFGAAPFTVGPSAKVHGLVSNLAEDFNLPLEAVQEAIAYCESNPPEIAQDWAAEEALVEADGMNEPDYKYRAKPRLLSPQAMARLNRL